MNTQPLKIIKENVWLGILGMAAALSALTSRFYYVGMINDDAGYVLGGCSLLKGRYEALFISSHPVLTFFPPGYPMFLAPWIALAHPHWDFLKFTSLLLSLINIVLAWRLYQKWLSPQIRFVCLGLFALNPVVLEFSHFVVSEPLFITCALIAFLLVERVISQPEDSMTAWWLGGVVGFGVWVRMTGLFLILAVTVGLLSAGRRRRAIQTIGVASFLVGGYFLRNYRAAHEVSAVYAGGWGSSLAELAHPLRFLDNWSRTTHMFFVYALLALRFSRTAWSLGLSGLLAAAVIALVVIGFRRLYLQTGPARALTVSAGVLSLSWYAVHSLWTAIGSRYALPVVPFLIPLGVAGFYAVSEKWGRYTQRGRRLIGISLAVSYAWAYLYGFHDAQQSIQKPERRPPIATWAWIQQHLPADSFILNPKAAEGYLYTGHYFRSPLFAENSEAFRYDVLTHGVTHVWVRPYKMQSTGENSYKAWLLNQEWTLMWPEAFKAIYRNPSEASILYAVEPDPNYVLAYTWYLAALSDTKKGDTAQALQKLDRALSADPQLASALNAYGTLYMLSGKGLKIAETSLTKAIRIRPSFPLAYVNLARVYHRQGRRDAALRALAGGRAAIEATGEADYLQPVIEDETKSLGPASQHPS